MANSDDMMMIHYTIHILRMFQSLISFGLSVNANNLSMASITLEWRTSKLKWLQPEEEIRLKYGN